jgi:Xaa-Pro dipeptidase
MREGKYRSRRKVFPIECRLWARECLRLLTAEVFRARSDRLRVLMRERGLDAVLVWAAPNSTYVSSTSGNVLYLADWNNIEYNTALTLTAAGEAAIFGASMIYSRAWPKQRGLWVERQYDFPEPLATRRELGQVAGGRVGLIGRQEMPAPFYLELVGTDNRWSFEDADDLLVELKHVRDEEEIELGRRAVENAELAFAAIVKGTREGKKVRETMADAQYAARYAGSDYCDVWVGPGPDGEGTSQVLMPWQGEHRPKDGDLVQATIYTSYMGRHTQLIRTGVKGKAGADVRRWVEVLIGAQQAAIDRLHPGARMLDAVKAMEDYVSEYAPYRWGEDPTQSRAGHVQGVQYAEPVDSDAFVEYLNADSAVHNFPKELIDQLGTRDNAAELLVYDGMRFELHPNFSVPGLGWICIGDNVVAGPDGGELLSQSTRECFSA